MRDDACRVRVRADGELHNQRRNGEGNLCSRRIAAAKRRVHKRDRVRSWIRLRKYNQRDCRQKPDRSLPSVLYGLSGL